MILIVTSSGDPVPNFALRQILLTSNLGDTPAGSGKPSLGVAPAHDVQDTRPKTNGQLPYQQPTPAATATGDATAPCATARGAQPTAWPRSEPLLPVAGPDLNTGGALQRTRPRPSARRCPYRGSAMASNAQDPSQRGGCCSKRWHDRLLSRQRRGIVP